VQLGGLECAIAGRVLVVGARVDGAQRESHEGEGGGARTRRHVTGSSGQWSEK
jgi:hypothetical protein